jgi:hypothetical protein
VSIVTTWKAVRPGRPRRSGAVRRHVSDTSPAAHVLFYMSVGFTVCLIFGLVG